MDFIQAKQALQEFQEKQSAFGHAMGLLSVDASTVAPKESAEGRGHTLGILSGLMYELVANPENDTWLSVLEAHKEELDEQTQREVVLVRKSFAQISRIPQNEYVEYSVLLNDAQGIWEEAKNNDDFARFAPVLEQIVTFQRKFAGYYDSSLLAYDALLNEYEEGLTMETLDVFFAELRKTLVPLIAKIGRTKQVEDSFLHKTYPIEIQRKLSDYVMEVMGLRRDWCAISESEHPFTSAFHRKDVRITTHYYEEDLGSSMYSVIHEGGHALYEMGCDPKYDYRVVTGGASMSIHESQSRFYENIIGRSEAFISYIYPKLQELFPEQLGDVSAEAFYLGVNKVVPSLIRTEADELTYCMHVMVRYELEKQLIAGELQVMDLPKAWNRLYKEYLGVDVPSDKEGCLQDSHWSGGSFGYFPSYALGSAYGAQMLHVMQEDLGDIFEQIRQGKLSEITDWLRNHIHRWGCMYAPGELLQKACGAPFDAKYYTEYLEKKYTKIYGLE